MARRGFQIKGALAKVPDPRMEERTDVPLLHIRLGGPTLTQGGAFS